VSVAWFSQSERGTLFWLHIITWIARRIGRGVAKVLLYPITAYFYLTSPATRKASREFLGRVYGRPATILETFNHHKVFAVTILDRIYMLTDRLHMLDVAFHNQEPLVQLLEQKRGCLLLGSHLGSFEVLRALGARLPQTGLRVLMHETHNQQITRFLNHLNPQIASTVIPIGHPDTMLRVKEDLEAGRMVGLLGDRVMGEDKKTSCTFLGEPAEFPLSPAVIALALKVPVYIFFGLYTGSNRYEIHFECLTEALDIKRPQRAEITRELTCRYSSRLEYWAKKYPMNWFNYYDYWHTR